MHDSIRFGSVLLLCVLVAACGGVDERSVTPVRSADDVTLTWLSVTNWLLEAGETRVLLDGYVSRVDRATVNRDGTSTARAGLDTAAVQRVREAILPTGGPDWILVGHAHWDHAFDAPAWSQLSGARIAGARTVCHHASAFGLPADRCTAVEGGETLALGPGVTARVVRWHHSGDTTTNGRVLRAPLELRAPPPLDSTAHGLRPGFVEDYPNGGGARAYLITIETPSGPLRIFWSNTGNPFAWDDVIAPDTALFRAQGIDTQHLEWAASDTPTRDHLARTIAAEGADSVDLWIGFGNADHVRQVSGTLPMRAFAPQHWDDFWGALADGPGTAFSSTALDTLLADAGVQLLIPRQYFDRIRLGGGGAVHEDGAALRAALGIRAFRQSGS